MNEKVIWEGSPSQWTNFGTYFWCTVLSFLIFPIFIALWKLIVVMTWKIKLTEERIIEQKGVFSKKTDEVELYRIKDIRLEEPFLLRLVGLSNIILVTSDKTHVTLKIPAIKNGNNIKEALRKAIDTRRDLKKVRELDL